jgi:polyvinyl alcohol dehydrogenase (cytochrome)
MRIPRHLITVAAVLLTAFAAAPARSTEAVWSSAGKDLANSRHQGAEKKLGVANVGALTLKWSLPTDGDVTANPAIDADALYFPDSAGYLYKVDRKTGALRWKFPVSKYTGIAGDFARATPTIVGSRLILGNQSGKFFGALWPQAARVFAVNKANGDAVWSTQVDATPMSFVTHSAIAANGKVYVGIASNEELIAGFLPKASFLCCNFRGSVVALDAGTGAVEWQTFMVPDGYSGGSIWGSTGAIDVARGRLYMATGNNFSVPDSVLACLNNGGTPAACMPADNHFDSVVALDLASGAIVWTARGLSYDAWNVGCGLSVPGFVLPPNDNCPNPAGPDWDFAQGPMLFRGGNRDLVGAGQKSGVFWAFDARTGALAWSTQTSPGGLTGGLQWGSAYDGQRLYVAAANSGGQPWPLLGQPGSSTNAGGWAALDPRTGAMLWQTVDPAGSRAEAAVSVANGVVYGCNLDFTQGTMMALNAATGAVLWSHASGGACNAGPSIADGMVFWGGGTFLTPFGPKRMHAFGL